MPSSLMDVASSKSASRGNSADALFRNAANRSAMPSKRFDAVLDQRTQPKQAPAEPEREEPEAAAEQPREGKSSSAGKAERSRRASKSEARDDVEPDAAVGDVDETNGDAVDEVEPVEAADDATADDVEANGDEDASAESDADADAAQVGQLDPSLLQQAAATQQQQQVQQTADATTGEVAESLKAIDPLAMAATDATGAAAAKTLSADASLQAADAEAAAADATTEAAVKPADAKQLGAGLEHNDDTSAESDAEVAKLAIDAADDTDAESATKTAAPTSAKEQAPVELAPQPQQSAQVKGPTLVAAPQQPQLAPEAQFVEDNHDSIVTSIRGELAKGGSVQLRLDPPSLGKINLQVTIDDAGVMSASMQTSNEEATRMLSHSLSQLKTALEQAGVSVDRIQVKQAPPADSSQPQQQQSSGDDDRQNRQGYQDQQARQEQQRREMLQKMWQKLGMGFDDLDLVA